MMQNPQREILQLNKVKDEDDVELSLEGEDTPKDPEEDIEIQGFSQIEEERKSKYVAEDFKLKRIKDGIQSGLWRIVGAKGGKIPEALSGVYTKETHAEATVAVFLSKQTES
jgi:hypothetical protein